LGEGKNIVKRSIRRIAPIDFKTEVRGSAPRKVEIVVLIIAVGKKIFNAIDANDNITNNIRNVQKILETNPG
jgi:hypothetical protein